MCIYVSREDIRCVHLLVSHTGWCGLAVPLPWGVHVVCMGVRAQVLGPFVAEASGLNGKRSYRAVSPGWQPPSPMCGGSSSVAQRGTELPPPSTAHGLVHVGERSHRGLTLGLQRTQVGQTQ